MSKEYLEAFKNLKQELYYSPNQIPDIDKWHETIEQALERLELIDDSDPSKAMDCIDYIENKLSGLRYECEKRKNHRCDDLFIQEHMFTTIKQALLKSQEQEDKAKAFDLINEKDVDIKLLKWAYPSVEAYNTKVRVEKDYWWRKELTKEEFEFIGRMVGAK